MYHAIRVWETEKSRNRNVVYITTTKAIRGFSEVPSRTAEESSRRKGSSELDHWRGVYGYKRQRTTAAMKQELQAHYRNKSPRRISLESVLHKKCGLTDSNIYYL